MKTKLSWRFWCALTVFGLMGQIAWVVENMYLNVFIYKMFNASASDISAMVAASAIAATLTTVVIGALSDRVGKRKLFICGGYIRWGVSIFAFSLLREDVISAIFPLTASAAAVGVSLTIILDCLMTFFGSSANDAAFNAWLTDSTDNTNRGAAEGINAMMPLVAILAVFGGFMGFDLDKSESWTAIFTIIGICTLAIGIIGFFIIEDKCAAPSETGYWKNVIYGFRPSTVRANKSFYFYLAAFVIFNIAIQIFMPYLIIYYEVSLGMADYVFIMAPAIILASVVTAFWGRFYDKKGFNTSSFFSLLWLAVGFVVLYLFKGTALVFLGSLLMMCGYLSGMAVFGAKIRDLTTHGKAGMLQGVRIFSQVLLPGVIGPYIGKTVLANAETIVNSDGTTSFVPNANIFLAALVVIAILAIVLVISRGKKKPQTVNLDCEFSGEDEVDWTEYPRPQMKRDSYVSLSGKWNLSVISNGETQSIGEVLVPFSPETVLSGISRQLEQGEKWLYEKTITFEDGFNRGRVVLHFGAVDQIAEVKINGNSLPAHIGGYLPFEYDITEYITDSENKIAVTVTDELDRELAYGKQRKDRGGMWYTPTSGIWQPVWLESVPCEYISALRITPTLTSVKIDTVGGAEEKLLTIQTPYGIIEKSYIGDSTTVEIDSPVLWTPENPYLYSFTLISGEDKIESYFALRTVSVEAVGDRHYIALNGKPYFFNGLLDQGYYSDGIYTPKTPAGFLYDIRKMKECGFNMLRKHIKIEPDLFYYYCDKLGMVVFQDMVNSGKYSFFVDTALPTIGIRRGIAHKASKRRSEAFEADSRATADLLYNHPCVCYYTIFNEGWGQYDADRIFGELKEYDPTRIWDATSGWWSEKLSDVQSEHIYFKKLDLKPDGKHPLVLSEFGGYSYKVEGHSFNLDKTYGYRFFTSQKDYEEALHALYNDEVIPMIHRGLCATVFTQVSDVEDETNGLLTYDRKILKVNAEEMKRISDSLLEAFNKETAQNP